MKIQKILILSAALTLGVVEAQKAPNAPNAKGIKARNLKGANLELMENHDTQSQLENFDLLPGYQVNLFAADPMLANPVHMQWDSRGRLWVACSWSYPQIKPGAEANDKIIILEDTNHDGRADKSTVFAEGLYIPTGLELANGGCYVAQSPDVYFLKDTDGDDVADVKQLALTGFGIEDSHHSISAWRRGPGGWIYFQEGLFLHSQIETQHGVLRNFNGGVYQFNPRTQELRMFCTGTGGNPWGHVFDRWGQSFMVNNPRIMFLSHATGNSGEKIEIKPLISTDKQCGGDLATGSHIGDDLRGQLLTGRFKSRSVVRYEFIENGAGFSARVLPPLISSKHPNFRPVDVKTGPDGAIYVADWYNSIINHAQHDFRDPRRDHNHGRIWRITHKDRPLVEKPKLVGSPIPHLVAQLASPEAWTRHQARKELSELDPQQVLSATEAWVAQLDPTLPDHDHHLVEAMWAVQNVELISEPILTKVLAAKDGHARAAGARVIRYWHPHLSDPVALIARLADDPFPRARMEAVLSAGFIPQAEAFAAALHTLDHQSDRFLDLALSQTKKALAPHWQPALAAKTFTFAKESHRSFVEKSTGTGFGKRLNQFLANPAPSPQEITDLQAQLRANGTASDLITTLNALGKKNNPIPRASVIAFFQTLSQMAPQNLAKPDKILTRKLKVFTRFITHPDDAIATQAIRNISAWRVPGANKQLIAFLKTKARNPESRQAAAIALGKSGVPTNLATLESLITQAEENDPQTRYLALTGLATGNLSRGLKSAARAFASDPADADPIPALQAILQQKNGAQRLTKTLARATLHPSVKSRVSEFHRRSGQLPQSLADLFQATPQSGASLSATLLAENQETLTADADQHGDAVRGEMIFRQSASACASCHAIGSAGPEIGPNLVAVGTAATTNYMIESILEPNAAIAEHYENHLFTIADGSVRMGVITFKSEKEVVIRDSAQAGKEIRLPAADIKSEQILPSLMPAGLADQLSSRQDFLDLVKFLSVLGQPGDFANNESPIIRKWQLLPAPADPSESKLPKNTAPWQTAYSKVNGDLPATDFPKTESKKIYARAAIEVLTPGPVLLNFSDGGTFSLKPSALNLKQSLRLWLNRSEIKDPTKSLNLEKGRHEFLFHLDKKPNLRLEFTTPAGSPIKFQPEGGM
ncbi:MAG: PVC-type heme-binding CxxCH protein [Akkermansiaceae bacterium]